MYALSRERTRGGKGYSRLFHLESMAFTLAENRQKRPPFYNAIRKPLWTMVAATVFAYLISPVSPS